ncbi:DPP IV N-terminal domain-containing protein [candidate division KSB1 bacterium]|nr:DPP IV N-terminal domain-containing protein [candidate division KSB1 bacterium]
MQNFRKIFFNVLSFATFFGANAAHAQDELQWTHPELKWSTIETPHFYVHFHNGAEHTGKLAAKIAEDVYAPITSLYGYEPDGKIHFGIKDYDDFSNGAAYYLDNKIEIWASALDFELRGTHNWLRNVITHEFTHMISLGAARKITRHIPAFYIQSIGYENEKRDDVLFGYPNRIISYPIAFTSVPPWFAEGVAQYQLPELEYDLWDTHRDMLLRTAVVESKMLTYSEMNAFGKNSIGSERVYNQGFSFSSYIAGRYGLASLKNIAQNMRRPWRFSFDGAIKAATGKSGSELYHEWKKYLEEKYAAQLRDIQAHKVEGELLQKEGTANFFPRWSPDGKAVGFLTNAGADYLGQTALVIRNQPTGKIKAVKAGVHYAFAWSPDGTKIVYSRKSEKNPGHSIFYDLFLYDLKTKKEKRLTEAARAQSPSWSPDGKKLACVLNYDGTQNLALFDLEKAQLKILTAHQNQEQVYTPQWSPDGSQILYGFSRSRGRDLYLYDLATGESIALLDDPADSRDAVFSPDGKTIYFSWDESGIFNIYSLDRATKQTTQLTNVIGSAFMPSVNQNGELVFSTFLAEGYKIAYLKDPQPLLQEHTRYLTYEGDNVMLASRDGNGSFAKLDVSGIKHAAYDDSKIPDYQIKPYRSQYTSVAFLPRLTFDYGTTKLGGYFYSSEMLDKFSFIGGAAANRAKDYDAFLLVDYKKLGRVFSVDPIFFLEGYNQVLHTNIEGLGVRYNLVQLDLGVRANFNSQHHGKLGFTYSRYNAKITAVLDDGTKGSFAYTYYIGKTLSYEHNYRQRSRAVDGEINPRGGREVRFRYAYEFNDFILDNPDSAFKVTEYGTLVEVYSPHDLHRVELDWTEHVGLPGRTGLTLYGRGGLLTPNANNFFYFFAGGLPGVRGYPYYSMEGRYLAHGRVTYRLPLFRHADFSLLHLYFDKVFLGVSYDYGGAFVKTKGIRPNLHDSINLQLRMDLYSFYVFPTRLFFNAAYGFDKFKNRDIEYGQEWRFYFGLSFGFLDE